jgi:hypothetical protein
MLAAIFQVANCAYLAGSPTPLGGLGYQIDALVVIAAIEAS